MNQRATNRDVLMETYKESKKDGLKKREKRGREVSFILLEEKRERRLQSRMCERGTIIYINTLERALMKRKRDIGRTARRKNTGTADHKNKCRYTQRRKLYQKITPNFQIF